MRAEKRETNQVPSALLQKFCLKINIAAYGGASGVLVQFLKLLPSLGCIRLIMSHTLADTIQTHYKIRRGAKNQIFKN